MTHSDPIADLLTRIKNAYMARHQRVEVPYSKIKEQIAQVLKREGYLKDVALGEDNGKKILEMGLLYEDGQPAIVELKRVSKPGLRIYVGRRKIPKVLSGLGTTILTTSQGIMTGREAKKKNVGGEVICEIS